MRRFMMIIETDLRSPLMMPFWRSRIGDDEPDKSNEPNKMEDPLLRDDGLSATAGESGSSSAAAKDDDVAGAGVGPGVARLEQDDQTSDSGTIRPRRRISTLAWILVPTALVFAGTFLAAAFLPAAPVPPKEEPADPPSNSSENNHTHLGQEPLAVTPTLLSVKDHETGELLSVKEEMLYGRIRDSTFHSMSDLPVYVAKQGAKILTVSNNEIRHGEALTLEWHSRPGDDGEDILALYCPAGEEDPRKFRDAATLPQAKATHAHCDIEKKDESRRGNDVWTIPSFPLVREESCEFRLYHHHTTAGGSGVDDGGEDGRSDVDLQQQQQHHYTFVASTGAISLTSSKSPTGIHLGLTGKPTEVFIQFATDDSGQPLAEIAKKSDVSPGESGRKLLRGVDWTKIKGSSTTYAAADMCQAPATSTDPGFFVNPGYLHTIRVQGLEAGVEYAYRVGLSFGQGVKWTDDYYVMRGPLPRGAGSSDPEKPALTFLSLANQGCGDSGYDVVAGADPPTATESDAQNVMNLIVSLIEGETVDAIHHLGNLAYADGAGHVWDAYANMIQSYAARVPITVGVGNHEYDHTDGGGDGKDPSGVMSMMGFHPSWGRGSFGSTGGECGVPVSKRFAVPEGGNGVFWYVYPRDAESVLTARRACLLTSFLFGTMQVFLRSVPGAHGDA